MTRRMSVSLTLGAVRSRTKTVTRRSLHSWERLKAGDRLTLIEKGMGLSKGSRQVVVAEVEIVSVTVEAIDAITAEEVALEGFPEMSPERFIPFWLASHGYPHDLPGVQCRRIEWRYLDGSE